MRRRRAFAGWACSTIYAKGIFCLKLWSRPAAKRPRAGALQPPVPGFPWGGERASPFRSIGRRRKYTGKMDMKKDSRRPLDHGPAAVFLYLRLIHFYFLCRNGGQRKGDRGAAGDRRSPIKILLGGVWGAADPFRRLFGDRRQQLETESQRLGVHGEGLRGYREIGHIGVSVLPGQC